MYMCRLPGVLQAKLKKKRYYPFLYKDTIQSSRRELEQCAKKLAFSYCSNSFLRAGINFESLGKQEKVQG